MNIVKYDNCVVLELDESSQIDSLLNFLHSNSKTPKHLIINLLQSVIKNEMLITNLLPFYINWQKRNKSFILVSNIRRELLKDMISISSLEEAFDFFHMEELTRSI